MKYFNLPRTPLTAYIYIFHNNNFLRISNFKWENWQNKVQNGRERGRKHKEVMWLIFYLITFSLWIYNASQELGYPSYLENEKCVAIL